jgi:hypothetical protein
MFIFSGEEGCIREAREGWPPLLTVETEANGDSRSTFEGGPSLVASLSSSLQYKRFLSCLGCPSRPSTRHLFTYRSLFHFIQDGQAVVPRRLSLNMCLWFTLFKTARDVHILWTER